MDKPKTKGCHHIGLTVSQLKKSAQFIVDVLGWRIVRRDDSYPSIFISDDTTMITLWSTRENTIAFDKNHQVGLHHLALQVESEEILNDCYQHIKLRADCTIEFSPELLRDGPAKHMMCFEPSGIRLELIWPGN